MRNLTEVEAARIMAGIARDRASAGKPRLTERQAAQILRAHRQVAGLPTVTPPPSPVLVPEPRLSRRERAAGLAPL